MNTNKTPRCSVSAECRKSWRENEDKFSEGIKDDSDDEDMHEFDDEYVYESEQDEHETDSDYVEEDEELDDEYEKNDCVSKYG